jgi:hypothetical protein
MAASRGTIGMAHRRRPLVHLTRPVPPADRYELRDVDTDHVLASIRVTTLANPLSHAAAADPPRE